jgi:[acyl-carrier-protein] S-malonyltransferase
MKAFVFPGQGSQIIGMGKDFYDNFKEAETVFKEVDDVLGRKLSSIIFGESQEELTKTQNAQPALMTVSMAILKTMEKEIGKPAEELCEFVAGHSLGEYSALCASSAISLAETAKLLEIRGKAFAKAGKESGGSMAAIIGVDVETAMKIAEKSRQPGETCQVANDNAIGQVVISGDETAIDRSIEIATEMGAKRAIKLPVSGAFHSELMRPAAEIMEKALEKITIQSPKIPLITNVTANQVFSIEEIKESLIKQVTGRVRWRETLHNLDAEDVKQIVEIGSGKVLAGLTKKTCPDMATISIGNIETMKEFLGSL